MILVDLNDRSFLIDMIFLKRLNESLTQSGVLALNIHVNLAQNGKLFKQLQVLFRSVSLEEVVGSRNIIIYAKKTR